MWTRNNDVSNRNMLKHFIYSSSSKSTTSPLCSLYYRYSSKLSSFFCILSFLVIAISIDQTFYSATHYLAAVWLDSRHDLNKIKVLFIYSDIFLTWLICKRSRMLSYSMMSELKLIWEWKLLFMKKKIKKMTDDKMLLSTNSIISSHLDQSFCIYKQKNQRYRLMFWLTCLLWSSIWKW